MNERILKLVEQARQYAWENETHWSANAEREALFEQKFAELIVAEMLQTCEDHPAWTGRMISEEIQQRFGVEE